MLKRIFLLIKNQLPLQLVLSIGLAFGLSSLISPAGISFFFGVSTLFVDILLFILPIVVFAFISKAILQIARKDLWVILLIFVCVIASNMLAILTAYGYGCVILKAMHVQQCTAFLDHNVSSIAPAFKLSLPTLLRTDQALLAGLVIGGLYHMVVRYPSVRQSTYAILDTLNTWVIFALKSVFIPLIPLYVFGFCLKLSYEGTLLHLFTHYGCVFVGSLFLVVGYILFLYFLGSRRTPHMSRFRCMLRAMRVMLPAGLTGFSTMSSAAAMPLAIEGASENTCDEAFGRLIIPSTTNIHMLGDDLTITLTALSLMLISGQPFPDFMTIILFAAAFAVAKLSCVGIPGASVLVVLPVLENYLGFTPSMIGMLTTIYILQDSIGTASNVMGNGAFAMIIHRIFNKVRFKNLSQ